MKSDSATAPQRTNWLGAISLAIAAGGALACQLALARGVAADGIWLHLLAAGFEAGVVGGLADWFAVTALFRHPFGIPVPHTRIIPKNRKRIIQGIVETVEKQWLSPAVIRAKLDRLAPSGMLLDWLADPEHVERIARPAEDLVRSVSRLLDDPEVVAFATRSITGGLRELPLGADAGIWIRRAAQSPESSDVLRAAALSLVNLAERPRTATELHLWLIRAAKTLRDNGRVVVPFLLRRKSVQRTIVDAALGYASSELRGAADDPAHPLRVFALEHIQSYATKLEAGEPRAVAHLESLRTALVESLETGPALRSLLAAVRRRVEDDLGDQQSPLARLVRRQIRERVPEIMADPERRARFDRWVRDLALDLVERHHDEIGKTVRENLEALDDDTLVSQIESRVGGDLQYIRLNGALVGGLIGVALATLRLWL